MHVDRICITTRNWFTSGYKEGDLLGVGVTDMLLAETKFKCCHLMFYRVYISES
jgi:hypothetical protein